MLNNKIKVYARIKPSTDVKSHLYEIKITRISNELKKTLLLLGGDDKNILNIQQKMPEAEEFIFENVFTENTSQEMIYNSMAKPVIQRAIEGFNGTIMAYGQTGTGKTHTICGGREKGIIPRAFKDVFHTMKEMKQVKNFKVFLSVMEIYNDHAYDLLAERLTRIGLARDKSKQVIPRNLRMLQVTNMHELDNLLKIAWRNRAIGETPMNDVSSRSHCIFSLHLHQCPNNSSAVMISKVHMIDLSGSEKVGKRRSSDILLNETRHINLSLHYIELVIRALSDKNRDHIPYRNSMITSFLRDSLGGNSNTVMVFTLSLDSMFYEETVLTCRFAQRVSLVSNKMKKQISQSRSRELCLRKKSIDCLKQNETNGVKLKTDILIDNNEANKHKSTNCKIYSSESSLTNYQEEFDKMNNLENENLIRYIEEMLNQEDSIERIIYCCEQDYEDENKCVVELAHINKTIHFLTDLMKAPTLFSPRNVVTNDGKYSLYKCLGLTLPMMNPETGKLVSAFHHQCRESFCPSDSEVIAGIKSVDVPFLFERVLMLNECFSSTICEVTKGTPYTPNEKEEFYGFLSKTFNLENFKNNYHDKYCDLLTKQYNISLNLDKNIFCLEQLNTKLSYLKTGQQKNPGKIEMLEKQVETHELKIRDKETLLKDITRKRNDILNHVKKLKKKLVKQFNKVWLPEKEIMSNREKINPYSEAFKHDLGIYENKTHQCLTKTKSSSIAYNSSSNSYSQRPHSS